ncbi:MAG TPA: tRNA pseudouridine(55) synthase TruB [Candidatus Enterenecus merdae]|nr:tRNA pseudouridine(55) synthase TruB [Candidatus Enterenecus merdae]
MASGIVIVDKPAGWTSMDVCAKLRGLFQERRVGHAGTLDPMATGVLPVFVGRATRAVEFAAGGDKEYVAGLRLGMVTDTQDVTGTVLDTRPAQVSPQELEGVLARFRGEIQQIPPMYSAVKLGGQKLYELARKGRQVERPPRAVTIHALEVLGRDGEDYLLRVRCSKGTYVRTLCHDIGAELGCGGCMSSLRRTMAAGYTLDDAVELDQLLALPDPAGRLLPVDSCFAHLPALTLTPAQARRVRNGGTFSFAQEGVWRVYDPAGAFLAVCRGAQGRLMTIKSFFEV